MHLAGPTARLTLDHSIGPPAIGIGDIELALVDGKIVVGRDQIREAMLFIIGVRKFRPSYGDEIGTIGDVAIAVLPVGPLIQFALPLEARIA